MDYHDHEERERSEPCSARTNPFTEDEDTVSRKRQKTINGHSRSLSVDTTRNLELTTEIPSNSPLKGNDEPASPHTPPNMSANHLAEPTSSKVTINLRAAQSPESPTSSRSPATLADGTFEAGTRTSIESESDALSTIPLVETPSSSPSRSSSPRVEFIAMIDDNSDYDVQDPPLAIIGEDEESDVMEPFPGSRASESPSQPVLRMARHFQYDEIDDPEYFCQVRDWLDSYLDRSQDMVSFYDTYINNREVWMKIPEVINALSRRSRFFGAFLQRSRDGRQALTDMFSQFARLAGRFLVMDVASLEQHANRSDDYHPDLASPLYLRAYSFLLRKEENSHIGRNLETHYNWDWDANIAILSDCFKDEGGTIINLARLVHGQSNLLERNPKLAEQFTEPCRIAAKIISDVVSSTRAREAHHQQLLTAEQRSLLIHGHQFFKAMSSSLQLIIEKHLTNISSEAVVAHLVNLTAIHNRTLIHDNPETNEIISAFHKANPAIPLGAYLAKAISYSWKLAVLHKLIISAQMQLRVLGVTTMCNDLLHLYNLDKDRIEPHDNGLLIHFAKLLIQQQLVDYIVGVGSHPEIINESNNIIGFLVVTKTYTNQDTDRIWYTIVSSQDPRVVAATLRMLSRLLHLCESPQLLYLCQKLDEVPLHAFTPIMRDFCRQVIDQLASKWGEGMQAIKSTPYDLCVRLIRESSIAADDGSLAYPDLNAFSLQRMQSLCVFGPPAESRNVIYLSCIKDISSGSSTSLGSICLINLLLRRTPGDLHTLTSEYGLIQLLIQKLEESNSKDDGPQGQVTPHGTSAACLEALMLVVSNHPDTISPELGKRLWDALVGASSKPVNDRNNSWITLNSVMSNSRKSQPNVFILSCFRDYFPSLPATCFTGGALEFVKLMIDIRMEETRFEFPEEERELDSAALEQLWRMILTAPPNTVDTAAIKALVKVYIDSDLILTLPRAKARSIHQGLVERCLNQLKLAASRLKGYSGSETVCAEDMIRDATEEEYQVQEKTFARSLAVLREFLKAYQTKPQFAVPKPPLQVLRASRDVQGEPLEVKYQSFDGDKRTEVRSLTLGKLSTAASLLASLQEATGFKNYKVYYGGKPFELNEIDVCRSLEDLNLNGLILVQRREDAGGLTNNLASTPVTLEEEIMKHIDELWDYLGMHNKVAQEIHYFLIKFPVYGRLLEMLTSGATSHTEIFPATQPFRSLYAIHVIKETVVGSSHQEGLPEPSLERALSLIVAALTDEQILAQCAGEDLKACLAINLIDCLVQLLREPALPSSINTLLTKPLFHRLLQLLIEAKSKVGTNSSAHLTFRYFEAILEVSLHSPGFWKAFLSHLENSELLRELILDEPRPMIRKSIVKQIMQQCTYTTGLAQTSATEMTIALWPLVSSLIQEAVQEPLQCEDVFTLSLALFREGPVSSGDLGDLINEWGHLLLACEHAFDQSGEHDDCPEIIDPVALGLTNLLQAATLFAKASQQHLSCGAIGTKLFKERLFPDLSGDAEMDANPSPRLPLLHSGTRERLAETIFLLIKDDKLQYGRVIKALIQLVPYSIHDDDPYSFDLSWGFDRFNAIRSPTGYVGLRNLSNTCYLNSLFTQLFMNIPFRDFMLNLRVSDGGTQQKLLAETQTLFSYMQNSLSRYVDPASVASSIQTYDLTKIDVSIQMDVDEFYNLLFDRWEGQILSATLKRKFKSFYGGQLVQQVKSKECDHISEREESFSAIQCEIKGKTCLQESLQAYVEGEVMEGDNKYKCSTCDRHVDAVKRACLKEVPDNLIFHLKRFDFNLRTLQRSKINDHFTFPKTIDMRPYKVDYIMDSGEQIPEDEFELVGVLVHSGTAESGHYYSYIRERPSTGGKQPWVEFNDEIVTLWDPSTMESCCFGGPDLRPGGDPGYDKSYSAYMLFYQRASTLAQQHQTLEERSIRSPVRLDVPTHLASHIAMENELTLRKYCLYDPSHTVFVSKMLGNMKKINAGHCSESHEQEKLVLRTALNHLDQVVTRAKDLPQFSGFLGTINRMCQNCAECSRDYLEWLYGCPEALRQMLLRNPDSGVRSETSSSILAALKKVKADASYAYGLQDDSGSPSRETPPRIIHKFVESMDTLYDTFHQSTRAWPEYFGLLGDIANLGREESAILLDNHFLQKTLSIVCADPLLQPEPQYLRMWNNISKRMATRPVSYEAVISLLFRLLQSCDGSLEPVPDKRLRFPRAVAGRSVPLVQSERQLLVQQWSKNDSSILVDKLLRINQNEYASMAIITWLLKWPEDLEQSVDHSVLRAILGGLHRSSSTAPIAPFVGAAFVFCEHSEGHDSISTAIQEVAKAAYSADYSEGKEFIQFFKDTIKLVSNSSNTTQEEIVRLVIENVHLWGPTLLTCYDAAVRESAEALIHELVLQHGGDEEVLPDDEDNEHDIMIRQAARRLGFSCLEFIQETYLRQKAAAVQATMFTIQVVIEACSAFFSKDEEDPETNEFQTRRESVLNALKKCLVDEIDEETSEWEASDEYPSSEPELNDAEAGI